MPTPHPYTTSIAFDRRLYKQDIAGSKAHARMLGKQGIVSGEEVEAICGGLDAIQAEIESGVFPFREELEDIHMNVETRLAELIGEAAGRLHTARSRNDQVALDVRMFVRDSIDEIVSGLRGFQASLLSQAEANVDTIIPGYTHLQRAQPVLVAHHLLAYFEMAQRDVERLGDCRRRVNVLPLGAGALAGVTYDIDREFVARELWFDGVGRNSMDAVSDRDFPGGVSRGGIQSAMMHLSRLAEEMIIWTSEEFGFREAGGGIHDGKQHHAAEAKPGRCGVGQGEGGAGVWKPDGNADYAQGAALVLQQGYAGGQGGAVRYGGHAEHYAGCVCRYGGDDDGQPGANAEGSGGGGVFGDSGHGPCGLPGNQGCSFQGGARGY